MDSAVPILINLSPCVAQSVLMRCCPLLALLTSRAILGANSGIKSFGKGKGQCRIKNTNNSTTHTHTVTAT